MNKVELTVSTVPLSDLLPYASNAKLHTADQIDQIAQSIQQFGNCDPIAAWHNESGEIEIVEGHGRVMALAKLGRDTAQVIFLDHLSDEQRRAYSIIHNKLTMSTGFDFACLVRELSLITDIDMAEYGFSPDMDAIDITDLFDHTPQEDEEPPKTRVVTVKCECCGETFDIQL